MTSVALERFAGPWESNMSRFDLFLLETLKFSRATFSQIHSDIARLLARFDQRASLDLHRTVWAFFSLFGSF